MTLPGSSEMQERLKDKFENGSEMNFFFFLVRTKAP